MKIVQLGFTSTYANETIKKLFVDGRNYLEKYISGYDGEVCHYFPLGKLKNILCGNEILFSDIEFLNDSQEEANIFLILKELLDSNTLNDIHPELLEELKSYDNLRMLIENDIRYSDSDSCAYTKDKEFIYNSRRYIFCTSKDMDCLAMWKYYSKGERYEALNMVFSPNDLVNCIFSDLSDVRCGIRLIHGSVIYNDKIKENILQYLINEINKIYIEYLNDEDGEDRNHNIRHEIINRFFYLLKDYSMFFKNEAYTHEEEYRFILEIDNTNIKKFNIKYDFRQIGAYYIPYIRIPFDNGIIKMLVINPTDAKNQLAIKSYRAFLDYNGYEKCDLGISTIPLRY